MLRNVALGPLCSAQESCVCVDGHDARNNWNRNTFRANPIHPIKEYIRVVEHLGDNEGGAGIDFFLEVVDELVHVIVVVTSFGVSSNTNVEVVAISVPDVFDQVLCIAEASSSSLPLFSFTRRIASQGEYVCATGLVGISQGFVELRLLHVGAGKVHTRLEAIDGLGDFDHFAGQLGVAPTGAPCEINELGTEAMHAVHTIVEILDTLGNVSLPLM
jgi:hypothetical protein